MLLYLLLQAVRSFPHVFKNLVKHGETLVLMLHIFKGFHLVFFCGKKFHILCLLLLICKK